MFVTLWEFEVKPGSEELFEDAYGPEGDWVRLFRGDASYRGTRLLRDISGQGVYVTIDEWESREAYEEFRQTWAVKYLEIDKKCEGLTAGERQLL